MNAQRLTFSMQVCKPLTPPCDNFKVIEAYFYLGYWLKMAFFQGIVVFFRMGTKLSPSEHKLILDESSGHIAAEEQHSVCLS